MIEGMDPFDHIVKFGSVQPKEGPIEDSYAILSTDERYRFLLARMWDIHKPYVLWVMLNPSVADHTVDDQTIRRVRTYTRAVPGAGGFMVVNLYAYRSTFPSILPNMVNPAGVPWNDWYIQKAQEDGRRLKTVAAWGATQFAVSRARWVVTELLKPTTADQVMCLGLTKNGFPRHPSRLADDTQLAVYARQPG